MICVVEDSLDIAMHLVALKSQYLLETGPLPMPWEPKMANGPSISSAQKGEESISEVTQEMLDTGFQQETQVWMCRTSRAPVEFHTQ